MQVTYNVPIGNIPSVPSTNAQNSVRHRDPRLEINGLVNGQRYVNDFDVFEESHRYYYADHGELVYPFPIDKVCLRKLAWTNVLTP